MLQKLAVEAGKYNNEPSFCGSGIQKSLDAWIWDKVYQETVVKLLAGGTVSSGISAYRRSALKFTYTVVRWPQFLIGY